MKDNYPIVIYWRNEGEAFIADLPDLRFCSAWGHTPEEAPGELLIVGEAWLAAAHEKGRPLPNPRESRDLPVPAREALRAEATT